MREFILSGALVFGCFSLPFIGCTNKKVPEEFPATDEQVINDTLANPIQDSIGEKSLSDYVYERLESNPLTETKVKFNDGSILDLATPLDFSRVKPVSHTYFLGDILDKNLITTLDENGVVLLKNQYHITEIGRIALFAINDYKKTGNEESKKVFLNQMKWIEDNFYEKEHYGFWYFHQDSPLYYLDPGWTSAMSQGWLMNACMEAYRLTKEKKYANLVEKALKGYMVPVENGGFMRKWNEDELWFEEYGTARPSRVLNGGIFGLEAVYNIYRDTKFELAKKIFESGVATLKNHLNAYDPVWTSRYNLADWKNENAQEHYHEIHVHQMLWLYRVTKDPIFKEYAQKFLENDRQFFFRGTWMELEPKMKDIIAEHTIDTVNHDTNNLLNEAWGDGDFWSSHRPTELIIDFGRFRKNINGLTLFHVNDRSKNVNFKLYSWDDSKEEWNLVQEFIPRFIKDKISVYHFADPFETYIEHFKIFESANARKVKLWFDASNESIVALRNLNFIFDRSEEIDQLEKRVNNHYNKVNNISN